MERDEDREKKHEAEREIEHRKDLTTLSWRHPDSLYSSELTGAPFPYMSERFIAVTMSGCPRWRLPGQHC